MAINLDNTNLTSNLLPNVLDEFYSYSYNITLKLYGYDLVTELRNPELSDRSVVIAETGTTAQFFIKSLEMNSNVGILDTSHGIIITNITMILQEPLGFSLVDRLLQAGVDLGLPSLYSAACAITISFNGWDANGAIVQSICQPKQIICTILSIVPDFSRNGSSYTLTFIPYNDLASNNKIMEVPKPISFEKADTLDQTLKNFADKLTAAHDVSSEKNLQTISGNKDDPDRYRLTWSFNLQDNGTSLGKLSTWTMDKNKQQSGDQSTSVTNPNNNVSQSVITVQPGTHVADVVTSILGNTKEAYKFTCPAASPQTAKMEPNDLPGFFTYEPIYTVKTFDPNTGGYSADIKFNIIPKIVSRNNFLTTQTPDIKTITQMQNSKILVKGYEYIFTGKNTDVLDVKLDFNSLWVDSIAMFSQALKDRSATILAAQNTSPISDIQPTMKAVKVSDIQDSNNQSEGTFVLNANRPDIKNQTRYLEDYSTTLFDIERFSKQEPSRDASKAEQVVRGASSVSSQQSNAKISIFSYMYDLTTTGNNMAVITLTIRGDPWWLGITPQEANSVYSGKTYSEIQNIQSDYAVYQYGEQNVFMKFKTPTNININTGLMNVEKSSVFNRIYSVIAVKHILSGGAFKQELLLQVNRSIKSGIANEVLSPQLDAVKTKTVNETLNELSTLDKNITLSNATTIPPVYSVPGPFGNSAPPVVPNNPTPTTPLTFTAS